MHSVAKTALGLTLLAGAVAVGAYAFVLSGSYDIGADAPHSRPVFALLDAVRRHSVDARARDIDVPRLDDPAMIAEGAEHYSAMCTGCHLAPGIDDSEIRPGLYPQPPKLADVGAPDPRATFWIIKHGIKMSGMPAWGATHDDQAIWNIVAFLRKLPALNAEQYKALTHDAGDEDHHDAPAAHDEHADDHDHAAKTP